MFTPPQDYGWNFNLRDVEVANRKTKCHPAKFQDMPKNARASGISFESTLKYRPQSSPPYERGGLASCTSNLTAALSVMLNTKESS
jgi:hypothetical protein